MTNTKDPNRNCWNCKHWAPEDRTRSLDGECCVRPPRSRLLIPPFVFPSTTSSEWCGNWERNPIYYALPL